MKNLILLISLSSILINNGFSDIKSSTGSINFDLQSNENHELTLNSTGLGIGTSSPSSNLEINGTFAQGVSSANSSTNIENLNSIIIVTASDNNVVLTLPNPSEVVGRVYTIKHNDSSVTSTLTSSSNIDGLPFFSLKPISHSNIKPFVTVISDGSEWAIINQHTQSIDDSVASSNLVLWWGFDDSPTTVFEDFSDNDNDAVINGSPDYTQVEGRIGGAILSNTNQTFATLSHNSTTTLAKISVGFWLKANDAATASWSLYSSILSKMDFGASAGWQFDLNNGVPFRIRTRTDVSSSDFNNVTTNIDVFDDTWKHVVYTAGEGNISFYVDGTQSATRTYDTGSGNTISNTTGFTLSLKEDLYIDEVRVYDRILDSTEVSEWFAE